MDLDTQQMEALIILIFLFLIELQQKKNKPLAVLHSSNLNLSTKFFLLDTAQIT